MHPAPRARDSALALLVPLCFATQPASAFDWFPRDPGVLDQLHLVQRAHCDDLESQILGRDVMPTGAVPANGVIELSADTYGQGCPLPPPWNSRGDPTIPHHEELHR